MNVFICENIQQPISYLNKEESHHCVRVLRMKQGDQLILLDGNGTKAVGQIDTLSKTKVSVKILELFEEVRPKQSLHICIAPTKSNDRIEWFLEKATELNCTEISLVTTFNSERKKINLDRFQKQIITACKQSKRSYFPKLNDIITFKKFIESSNSELKFIATLHNNENYFQEFATSKNCIVLIGPEGGFSVDEVKLALQYDYKPILLGSQRLRTETAGVFAASVFYQKWYC